MNSPPASMPCVTMRSPWAGPTRVVIIDEDQGQSGASAQHRHGFQRLLAEVTLNHVGLVLGLEMSRLARSSKDWHHLLEVCALFGPSSPIRTGCTMPTIRMIASC